MRPEDLHVSPNALAPHYSRFRVAERLLLTGHSHQAWPDRALAGQLKAWEDAAEHVDKKWERAFAAARRVERGYARLLEDDAGLYALAPNTHDLVVRFLSSLPLRRRPRVVTTDGEFHTLRRQLTRLEEEGLEVVRVAALPADSVAGRLIDAVDERAAAVMVSSVFYRNAHIAGDLGAVLAAAREVGAELLVDAYHSLNAVPFSLPAEGLEDAWVVGGGYKYCQLGEGNCFLRFPPDRAPRPAITGWFSSFETLELAGGETRVAYGEGGARFAGSTYDPTSHYRAAEVFAFFAEHGLTPAFLRRVSQHQVGLLARLFDDLDLPPALIRRDRAVPLSRLGGFLALTAERAGEICAALEARGVLADWRRDILRLGPAPYLSDDQLAAAMTALGEVARGLGG